MNLLFSIVVLSLWVEAVTYLIKNADILSKVRNKVFSVSDLLGELLSCGYCLSFWVTLLTLIIYSLVASDQLVFFEFNVGNAILNFILGLVIVHRVSGFIHGAVDKHLDKSLDKRYFNLFDPKEKEKSV